MIRSLFFISGFMCFLSAAGQNELSLPALVDLVLKKNYDIELYRNDERAAAQNMTLGNAGFLPSVSLQGEQSRSVNDTRQQFFNGEVREGSGANSTNLNALARVDWVVFDGFGMFARRDKLAALSEISASSTKLRIEETIADISELYFSLVHERSRLESFQSSLEISGFRKGLEEQRYRAGASDKLTLNQAVIDHQADSMRLIGQLALIREIEIQINQISNRRPDETITPVLKQMTPEARSYSEWLDLSKRTAGEIRIADLERVIADADAKLSRSLMYPQVGLFGQYSFVRQENEIGFLQSNRNAGLQYGLSVRFNLFDGGQTRSETRNSFWEQQKAEVSVLKAVSLTESAVATHHGRLQYLIWQKDLAAQRLELAEQNIGIAREQLRNGAISGFDFRQSQLTLLQAQNDLAAVNYAIAISELSLHRLAGSLLDRVMSL